MLLFRSEENIDRWCAETKMPRGVALGLDQLWQLSKLWYSDRLSPDFAGRTAAQVEAIFEKVGLTATFWRLS
ncbi:MAG: hypothetical protein Kow0031_01820 [Anaerolineae bacterium]